MMARAGRSPSRMTALIMPRSRGSMTPEDSPSAISALISSAVTADSPLCRPPNSRRIALPETSSSQTRGAEMRASIAMPGATVAATASALRSAICFGTSSPTMSDR